MLRKVSAVITCLLFTLGILTFVNLLTEDADAGYDRYKRVTWIIHYETPQGEFCFQTEQTNLVPLDSPHRRKCHNRNADEDCDDDRPHGTTVEYNEQVVDTVIIPNCDC